MNKTLINDFTSLQFADLDAGQVFSGKPSGTTVRGYATPSACTPSIDHNYIFHESSRDIVVWFVASAVGESASRTDEDNNWLHGNSSTQPLSLSVSGRAANGYRSPQGANEPLYVFGPTGCGKTGCIKQLAARLNYPVFEVTGHGLLEFADLVGHLTVTDGNMAFEYGPYTAPVFESGRSTMPLSMSIYSHLSVSTSMQRATVKSITLRAAAIAGSKVVTFPVWGFVYPWVSMMWKALPRASRSSLPIKA